MAAPTPNRLERWDAALSDDTNDEVVARLLSLAPFRDMNPENFPRSAPLRDVLKNDTRVVRYRKGQVVVREGDFGTSAFMVLDGSVQVVLGAGPSASPVGRRRPARNVFRALAQLWTKPREDEVERPWRRGPPRRGSARRAPSHIVLQDFPRVLDADGAATLESGEFFGEISALARIPRPATIIARDDGTELLEIRWQGLRDLMRYDRGLRQHIDGLYRQRALVTFLAEIPFLQHLTPAARQQVADAVQFETYGEYDWSGEYRKLLQSGALTAQEPVIITEGDYPNGVVLIRSGFARVTGRYGHGHRTLNYLGAGRLFGFEEVAHNWRRPDAHVTVQHTLRVVGYAHVLVIPVSIIESVVLPAIPEDELPSLLEPPGAAHRPIDDGRPVAKRSPAPAVPPAAAVGRLEPGLMEFLSQHRYFNGTETMVIDLNRCTRCDDCVRACADTHDNNPRFLRHGEIHDYVMVAQACMHCADPVCMIGCPTGAIHRDDFGGEVVINPDTCIGCTACANSCPYGAIRMVEARNDAGEILLAGDARPILKATKCDLCVDQHGGPACVRACPHDALARLNLNTPDDLLAWLRQ